MRTELEYNLAGGLLYTIQDKDLGAYLNKLADAGYKHGCLLPFRALTAKDAVYKLAQSRLTIVHLERAWNPIDQKHFLPALMAGAIATAGQMLKLPVKGPYIQDAAFPPPATCDKLLVQLMAAFPKAKVISYEPQYSYDNGRFLVGVDTVGRRLGIDDILAGARDGDYGLVFDPRHILLPGRTISLPGQPTVQKREWEGPFLQLAKHIEVVDIHPSPGNEKREIRELLRGSGFLKEVAIAAREANIQYLRVEIPIPLTQQFPGSPLRGKGFEFLREIEQALMN